MLAPYRQLCQVVEHRLAYPMHLVMHQARYFGHTKTRFQLFFATTVANLVLAATRVGLMRGQRNNDRCPNCDLLASIILVVTHVILTILPMGWLRSSAFSYR